MADKKDACAKCRGMCCKYVSLEIDAPGTADDFDTFRWYVSHEGCSVYLEEGTWYFEVMTPCENLAKDNRCNIYARRPEICREHNAGNCEALNSEFAWDIRLETLRDVEDYARLAMHSRKTRGSKFDPPWDRRARKEETKQKKNGG